MNTGDKVVCIDDSKQRTDKNDAPNGLAENGKVYCVAGMSPCGGLVLVGLPSRAKRDGKETGFRPSRFCRLEYFRAEFAASKTQREPVKI